MRNFPSRVQWATLGICVLVNSACSGEANIDAAPRDLIPADSLLVLEFDFSSLRDQWGQLAIGRGLQPYWDAPPAGLQEISDAFLSWWPRPEVDPLDALTQARFTFALRQVNSERAHYSVFVAIEPFAGGPSAWDYRLILNEVPTCSSTEAGSGLIAEFEIPDFTMYTESSLSDAKQRHSKSLRTLIAWYAKGSSGEFLSSLDSNSQVGSLEGAPFLNFFLPGENLPRWRLSEFFEDLENASEELYLVSDPASLKELSEFSDSLLSIHKIESWVIQLTADPPGIRESHHILGNGVGQPLLVPGLTLDQMVKELHGTSVGVHRVMTQVLDISVLFEAISGIVSGAMTEDEPSPEGWIQPAEDPFSGFTELTHSLGDQWKFMQTLDQQREGEFGRYSVQLSDSNAFAAGLQNLGLVVPSLARLFLNAQVPENWAEPDEHGWVHVGALPSDPGESPLLEDPGFRRALDWAKPLVGENSLVHFEYRSAESFHVALEVGNELLGLPTAETPAESMVDELFLLWGPKWIVVFMDEHGLHAEARSPLGAGFSESIVDRSSSFNADGEALNKSEF